MEDLSEDPILEFEDSEEFVWGADLQDFDIDSGIPIECKHICDKLKETVVDLCEAFEEVNLRETEDMHDLTRQEVIAQPAHAQHIVTEKQTIAQVVQNQKIAERINQNRLKRLSDSRKNAETNSDTTLFKAISIHYKIKSHCLKDVPEALFSLEKTIGHTLNTAKMPAREKVMQMQNMLASKKMVKGKTSFLMSFDIDHYVCRSCFCDWFQLSSKTMARVLTMNQKGQTVNSNCRIQRWRSTTAERGLALQWIVCQIKCYGEYMPHTGCVHLVFASVMWFHRKYTSTMMVRNQDMVKRSTFYRIFDTFKDVVRVVKYSCFAKCDLCFTLKTNKKNKIQAVRESASRKYNIHMLEVEMDNHKLFEIQEEAIRKPHELLSIGLDGMTQNTTRQPYLLQRCKAVDACYDLPTSIYGGLVHGGDPGPIVFLAYGDLCKDSSYTAQAILRTIKSTFEQRGLLGATLVLNLDGTTRENKNGTIAKLLAALVEADVFDECWVFFKLTGHTHNQVDQFWGVISIYLRKHGAIDGNDLVRNIKRCYTYLKKWHPTVIEDMEVGLRSKSHIQTHTEDTCGLHQHLVKP
jgi:hypothetical protein